MSTERTSTPVRLENFVYDLLTVIREDQNLKSMSDAVLILLQASPDLVPKPLREHVNERADEARNDGDETASEGMYHYPSPKGLWDIQPHNAKPKEATQSYVTPAGFLTLSKADLSDIIELRVRHLPLRSAIDTVIGNEIMKYATKGITPRQNKQIKEATK